MLPVYGGRTAWRVVVRQELVLWVCWILDTQSFLQQTFKYSHVPGIGWDGKVVGSTGNLGQSSKR